MAKRKKQPSRADRWNDAVGKAQEALAALSAAREELEEVKQEYDDWLSNLPDNLRDSPVGQKLQEIEQLDLDESSTDWVETAAGMDLPLGFGRD